MHHEKQNFRNHFGSDSRKLGAIFELESIHDDGGEKRVLVLREDGR